MKRTFSGYELNVKSKPKIKPSLDQTQECGRLACLRGQALPCLGKEANMTQEQNRARIDKWVGNGFEPKVLNDLSYVLSDATMTALLDEIMALRDRSFKYGYARGEQDGKDAANIDKELGDDKL